ncbi:CsbD family protein [Catellatospora paridis]|uniref:CsbD family protein n=1 Tax=Catellatospora paridis TaxID=1617086 RepID=UPI0012D3AFD4|nr:CsbD family protein [Catellatospora paridis]
MGDISNKAEELKGKAKEVVGDLTGNESLEAKGLAEQATAKAKQAAENVKDAAEDATNR